MAWKRCFCFSLYTFLADRRQSWYSTSLKLRPFSFIWPVPYAYVINYYFSVPLEDENRGTDSGKQCVQYRCNHRNSAKKNFKSYKDWMSSGTSRVSVGRKLKAGNLRRYSCALTRKDAMLLYATYSIIALYSYRHAQLELNWQSDQGIERTCRS